MPELPDYETILNILREAGFVLRAKDENCVYSGSIVSTAFANYLSITNDDAAPNIADITVTVNGEVVPVDEIDAVSGKITLSAAPESGTTVLVTYYYTPVPLEFVKTVRSDVECAIASRMRGVDRCAPYEANRIPHAIRLITRLWAAGLLLGKEYGYNADGENSASDGYRRIQEAKKLLEEFYNSGGLCGTSSDSQADNTGGAGDVLATSRDLFGEPRGRCCARSSDRYFEEF